MGIEDLRVEIEARIETPEAIKACLLGLPHVRYLHGYNAMSWFLYEDERHVIEILYYAQHYVCVRFALCSFEGIAEVGAELIQRIAGATQQGRIKIAERHGVGYPKEFERGDLGGLLEAILGVWEEKRRIWAMDYGGEERLKVSCAEALVRFSARARQRIWDEDDDDEGEENGVYDEPTR